MDKVITAKDVAERDGKKSQRDWIIGLARKRRKKNMLDTPFTGKKDTQAESAVAYIDHGRWLADCPVCNGTEYVDPDEKIFYCFSCGNFDIDGAARHVSFPSARERRQIEKQVMKREVRKVKGANTIQREMMAQESKEGPRNWRPEVKKEKRK
jgi:hypothetical protein